LNTAYCPKGLSKGTFSLSAVFCSIATRGRTDGFINGTAMCVAHYKEISDWLRTDGTWELVTALASDLKIQTSKIKTEKIRNSVFTRVSATYPDLVVSKRGSLENGGGVWLHHILAIQLAQWCSPSFAIEISGKGWPF